MGWSSSNEEARADHYRDSRKNDFEPIDRLDRPISTAMDIVALVKLQPDFTAAANLIELYAGMKAAQALRNDAATRLAAKEPV